MQSPTLKAIPISMKYWFGILEPGDCIAFHFQTLHGTTDGEVIGRRRALSTRWLGDDIIYCERQIETSPPYSDIGLKHGDRMREDWFPVLWRRISSHSKNR